MMLASVSKLNIHMGDNTFDRVYEEFRAAQDEGLQQLDIDVTNLDDEMRMDFIIALEDLGYDVIYDANEEILDICYE
jgi:hypothetical protein